MFVVGKTGEILGSDRQQAGGGNKKSAPSQSISKAVQLIRD